MSIDLNIIGATYEYEYDPVGQGGLTFYNIPNPDIDQLTNGYLDDDYRRYNDADADGYSMVFFAHRDSQTNIKFAGIAGTFYDKDGNSTTISAGNVTINTNTFPTYHRLTVVQRRVENNDFTDVLWEAFNDEDRTSLVAYAYLTEADRVNSTAGNFIKTSSHLYMGPVTNTNNVTIRNWTSTA